jgi:hypothetical protein
MTKSLLAQLLTSLKEHYKLAGSIGIVIAALPVIYYCGSISFYPYGLTIADTLFFMFVLVIFGIFYSIVAFAFFLSGLFWVSALAIPLNAVLKWVNSKLSVVMPFPKKDRISLFIGGLIANVVVIGGTLLSTHSLVNTVSAIFIIGFAYTLLDHATTKPWVDAGLLDSSGKAISEGRVSLNSVKLALLCMIYFAPLVLGQVGGGVTRSTFQAMGVRATSVEVVVPASTYQALLSRLEEKQLLEGLECNQSVCSILNANILFTGVGSFTKLQTVGKGGTSDLVLPTKDIHAIGKLRPNKSLQVTFAPPRTFASAKAPELRR